MYIVRLLLGELRFFFRVACDEPKFSPRLTMTCSEETIICRLAILFLFLSFNNQLRSFVKHSKSVSSCTQTPQCWVKKNLRCLVFSHLPTSQCSEIQSFECLICSLLQNTYLIHEFKIFTVEYTQSLNKIIIVTTNVKVTEQTFLWYCFHNAVQGNSS